MYHDNDNSEDEDEEELSYNEEDDNDIDEDEEAAPGPPAAENEAAPDNDVVDDEPPVVENNDDDDEGQADMQPSAEVEQPPGILPGEAAGMGEVDQDEEYDEHVFPEIPGVSKEETEPETPGVSAVEEEEASENGDDLPAQDMITGQLPPAPPGEDNGTRGRYNLRSDRNRSYNHRYAGKDLVVDDESGIVMTTEGTGEVLETLQMSLKAGLRKFGNDGVKAVEKEMRQLFKYTRKVRKNQIVTAGRLVTVLDMRPQMRGTRTNNNDSKVCSAICK